VDRKDFSIAASGEVIRVGRPGSGYDAFVPHPLPPRIEWTDDLVRSLSAADRAMGRLGGVGQTLPKPHLLIGPFKRREAVLSSRIEGTQASMSDLLLFEAAPSQEPHVPDVREVWNYVRALDYGLERRTTLPVSNRLIREMHARLLEGVRGEDRTPGDFRRSQNWIGPPGCIMEDATFVPPPPERLAEALDAFEKYLHEPSGLPPILRLALIHYQFEAIHPFLDGNGRLGRLLITLLLCSWSILPEPLLYLSAYFERHRKEYYSSLLAVSQKGAWNDWIAFFLRGVAGQSMDGVQRANRLLQLRGRYHLRVESARASALLVQLIDYLFEAPAVTVAQVKQRLGVTPRTAQAHIDRLAAEGIVREATGRKRNRVYLADEILYAATDDSIDRDSIQPVT